MDFESTDEKVTLKDLNSTESKVLYEVRFGSSQVMDLHSTSTDHHVTIFCAKLMKAVLVENSADKACVKVVSCSS